LGSLGFRWISLADSRRKKAGSLDLAWLAGLDWSSLD
jgi:hypothetical protein